MNALYKERTRSVGELIKVKTNIAIEETREKITREYEDRNGGFGDKFRTENRYLEVLKKDAQKLVEAVENWDKCIEYAVNTFLE